MAEHPIQGLMNVTMDKIRQMADSNTIIGKPIKTDDGTTILPVSRISFGFASAGTDFDGKNAANKDLFGGGSGAGVNIQPVAFLVVKDGCVRTIQLSDGSNTVDRSSPAQSFSCHDPKSLSHPFPPRRRLRARHGAVPEPQREFPGRRSPFRAQCRHRAALRRPSRYRQSYRFYRRRAARHGLPA